MMQKYILFPLLCISTIFGACKQQSFSDNIQIQSQKDSFLDQEKIIFLQRMTRLRVRTEELYKSNLNVLELKNSIEELLNLIDFVTESATLSLTANSGLNGIAEKLEALFNTLKNKSEA